LLAICISPYSALLPEENTAWIPGAGIRVRTIVEIIPLNKQPKTTSEYHQ